MIPFTTWESYSFIYLSDQLKAKLTVYRTFCPKPEPDAFFCVGWGHKVLPGERFTNSISKAQGDSILREDLRKLCRMFSYLGRDSLLAAVLSYNVGPYRLKGYGKRPKSRLLKKLESGDRNIYKEYVSFRCYKGKVVPSIERRRKVEFMLLFEE